MSHFSLTRRLTPLPSAPMTRPMGPVMDSCVMGVPPMSAHTNQRPRFFRSSIVRARLVTLTTGV